ncbi:exopolyphosphatase [Clostridium kluyveri]|uniref:Exopolyphosphatase n=1 Tax=Clostridium kluyveri TaxID=1534 RepID=A0A1L5F9J7_CLOKL|nr:exopolyphosphatase [Clostridium kluyveri]APM39500.1 exopolyphosphatase [Clostridium kluyveri]UZQ50342.1 exopolyphosphatase [Clostridium kluyveri]
MIRLGIIDIGSNSMRLVIAQIHEYGSFKIIEESKETIGLGKDMNSKGELNITRMNKAISALCSFKHLCTYKKVDQIIPVATEAVRKASNQTEFLNRVKNELNMDIRVLSGKEEAYYAYLGTVNSIDFSEGLLVDIGGSSTELIWVKERYIKESISLPIGAINLTEKFSLSDPIDKYTESKLIEFILSYYNNVPWLKNLNNIQLIGIGGSIRNIARINQKKDNYPLNNLHTYKIKSNEVKEIYENIKYKDCTERKKIKGLSKDRADISLGPMAALLTLQKFIHSDELCISSNGIREGLIYEYILKDKIPLINVLDFSLNNYISNLHVDKVYAMQIWTIIQKLYEGVKSLINASSENLHKILKTASLLYNCGINVSYYGRFRHSFYIISNCRINGLSHREQLISSYVAASQGKSTLKIQNDHYGNIINEEDIEIIEKLSVLLRVSRNLHKVVDKNIDKIQCTLLEKEVIINITVSSKVPFQLEETSDFEKIFNRKLTVEIQ